MKIEDIIIGAFVAGILGGGLLLKFAPVFYWGLIICWGVYVIGSLWGHSYD